MKILENINNYTKIIEYKIIMISILCFRQNWLKIVASENHLAIYHLAFYRKICEISYKNKCLKQS